MLRNTCVTGTTATKKGEICLMLAGTRVNAFTFGGCDEDWGHYEAFVLHHSARSARHDVERCTQRTHEILAISVTVVSIALSPSPLLRLKQSFGCTTCYTIRLVTQHILRGLGFLFLYRHIFFPEYHQQVFKLVAFSSP